MTIGRSGRGITIGGALILLGVVGLRADEVDPERVREALRGREERVNRLRVSMEVRYFRVSRDADPHDRSRWKKAKKLRARDWIVDCVILRPWWRMRLHDIHYHELEHDPEYPPFADYAWVDNELANRADLPEGPTSFAIMNHPNANFLGVTPFLTTLEIDCFSWKGVSLCQLLTKATQIIARTAGPERVSVEFPIPEWDVTVLAHFDTAHDWAPIRLEWRTHIPGLSKPHVWLMATEKLTPVGQTWIVGEAIIVNRNPRVPVEWVEVHHYVVREARIDPGLTVEQLRLVQPDRNVVITDVIRLYAKEIDAAGNVTDFEKLNMEELRKQEELLTMAAEEGLRRAREHRSRRTALVVIVSGAACLTVALGAVAWWRYRRGRMAA